MTIDIAHLDELVNLRADSGAISHDGILKSILAQVREIQSANAGAEVPGKLRELKDHVKAQSGKKIAENFAIILVDDISYIEAHLGR